MKINIEMSELINDKMNELLIDLQTALKIESGDVEPLLALRYDAYVQKLAHVMEDIVAYQLFANGLSDHIWIEPTSHPTDDDPLS